ncbi:hypothetical protein [Flammeovirga sp. SJP92]|uniref:hypothetical protein n=1 Tax=Flammeovirga sp. SJP92 TaxID=1775430 RepID=UPI00078911DE|nr:hypothetical protein [Flammeovirga sp. SJP92]KXX71733.1 hypothetical protein AVL50_05520 [Flammeovirga sp. SJP92]
MDNREQIIGYAGENDLERLCIFSNLTSEKADKDKNGWDFEVYSSNKHQKFSDLHKSGLNFKIQVKATDSQKRKIQVKLFNLRALASDPYPTFFIIFEYDSTEQPQRAFLIHIDHKLQEKILERVQKSTKGVENLHKSTMSLTYDETQLLKSLSGKVFRDKIEEYIGTDIQEYSKAKIENLQNCGVDNDDTGLINLTNLSEENLSNLIDVLIGVKEDITLKSATIQEKRFGVYDNPKPISSIQVSTPKSHKNDCKISFKWKNDLLYKYTFEGYSLGFVDKSLPDYQNRLAIHSDFFSLVISGNKTINFKIDIDNCKEYKFSELLKRWSIFKKMHEPNSETTVRIKKQGSKEIKMRIDSISVSENELNEINKIYNTLYSLKSLKTYFEIDDDLKISIQDLAQHFDKPKMYYALLKGECHALKFEFTLDKTEKSNLEKAVTIRPFVYDLKNFRLLSFLRFEGGVNFLNGMDRYNWNVEKVEVVDRIAINVDNLEDFNLKEYKEHLYQSLDAIEGEVIFFDGYNYI